MKERMQYCDWCGAELGIYRKDPRYLEHCGDITCAKEVARMEREDEETRRSQEIEEEFYRSY